jgi:hypothetical protein
MANVSWNKAQFDTGIEALCRAPAHARGRDKFQEGQITSELIMAMAFGPTPVQEVIREGEQMLDASRTGSSSLLFFPHSDWCTHRWVGFDHARELGQRATAICHDLGQHVLLARWSEEAALVEIAAGDLTAAEQELRRGCDALADMGEQAALSTKAAFLAEVIFAQGRHEEADECVALSKRSAPPDDI